MKDTIIKNTGNSRYLKSKLTTGTTWEQFRAMLIAGTLPIDLNGLNPEGIQQMGTKLDAAHLLSSETAGLLGLTGDAAPDDALRVFARLGDLHVWRKTITTASPINASYTQDEVTVDRTYVESGNVLPTPGLICWMAASCEVTTSSSFTLDPVTGNITQTNPTNYHYGSANNFTANDLFGRYVRLKYSYGYGPANLNQSLLYYIPADASITTANAWFFCDKLEYVNVTPYIPAGTTSTYPVSADRNAYQEGDNGTPPTYELGLEETGPFDLSTTVGSSSYLWEYSDTVDVSETGAISLHSPTSLSLYRGSDASAANVLIGKFFAAKMTGIDGFESGVVYFAPADAVISRVQPSGSNYYKFQLSKRQSLSGDPSIPATIFIDYLGTLGNKSRVQILSYVGTGTYGVNNPTSLTFDFEPKMIFVYGPGSNSEHETIILFNGQIYATSRNSTSTGFSFDISWSSNSVSWYNSSSNAAWQANQSGKTYKVIAIG